MKEAEERSQNTVAIRQKPRIINSKPVRFHPHMGRTTQNSKPHSRGFTLIELIIFIIIAGIFLPATYIAFSSSLKSATQPEDYTRGMLLAQEVVEIAKKRFSNNFVNNPSQVQADVTNPPTCEAMGVAVPSGFGCNFTASFINSLGGLSLSSNNYVQLSVSINTPQGNTFSSTGMVTNHGF